MSASLGLWSLNFIITCAPSSAIQDTTSSSKGDCVMKRLFAVFAFLLFFSFAAFGERLTGYISDEQCAASGSKAAKATDWINPTKFESCAQKCAKNGSPAVFVTEDNKVLKLDVESTKKAAAHLGHRVSVEGKVENG